MFGNFSILLRSPLPISAPVRPVLEPGRLLQWELPKTHEIGLVVADGKPLTEKIFRRFSDEKFVHACGIWVCRFVGGTTVGL